MPAASKPQKSATLSSRGIENASVYVPVFDLGTTCSRVYLVWNGGRGFVSFPDILRDPERADDDINAKATATFFQIDQAPRERIVSSEDGRDQTPVKFFPDIRNILELRATGATAYETSIRNQFPIFDDLLARYDALPEERKQSVLCHAEYTYLEFLAQVHVATKQRAKTAGCEIKKLLALIPSTWTPWMQEYYIACLKIVWKPLEDIELMHESEAIVNLVISRSNTRMLDSSQIRRMIVVDLGAHILSINDFCLELYGTDRKKFYLCRKRNHVAVPSGIHLHAALGKATIKSYIESKGDCISLSDEEMVCKRFMASYLDRCDAMIDGKAFVICAHSRSVMHHHITFSAEDSRQIRDSCFSNVFNTLDGIFSEAAADDESGSTEVVLAGGGFRNISIREEVEKRVRNRGFVLHDSMRYGFDTTQSTTVALGAADAILHAAAVDKFMQVACFAVWGGDNIEPSNSIIWSNGLSKTVRVSVHDPEEDGRLIVCRPAPKAAGVASIDETPFYEFSKLPRLPRGDYDLCLEYQATSISDPSLVLHAKDVHTRTDDGGEVKVVRSSRRYHIYYDCTESLYCKDVDQCSEELGDAPRSNTDCEEAKALRSQTCEGIEAQNLTRRSDGRPRKRLASISASDAISKSYAMFPQVGPEGAGRGKRRARRDHGDSPYYSR